MKPIQAIVNLNKERYGLVFNPEQAIMKLQEELDELKDALDNNDMHETVDALNDLIVVSIGELTKLGYDPTLCLKETVKEISSRKQDPKQAQTNWAGSKWKKDKNQDKSTLYTADYSTCRINRNIKWI